MRKQIWTAALSLVLLATLSVQAEACGHRWCNWCFPGPCGAGSYYGCAAMSSACVVGYPACGPIAVYGSCRRGWCHSWARSYNCGWGCVAPQYRCGWLCRKHYRHAARRAGKCGAGGCWSDLCGSGFCDDGYRGGCATDAYGDVAYGGEGYSDDGMSAGSPMMDGIPSDANIISDRVLGEGDAPEAIEGSEAADASAASYRLASYRKGGTAAFETGLQSFRSGSMDRALGSFDAAARAEPSNALYHYHRALVLFNMSREQAAESALQKAIAAEQKQPVKNWGKQMERVQGRGRVWVERARRDAGLVR